MIIGQAPALASMESGRNFSGRAGRILFSWFERFGLTEDQVRASVYITALTRCYPGRNPRGGDRKPSPRELALCRPFLLTELDLLAPHVVLPVGQMAIEHFLGKAPLGTRVGGVFEKAGVSFIPLPHPSGASRWLNDAVNKRLLDEALECVRELALPLIRTTLALYDELD
jgi:uracil-DNA glycosylase